MPQPENLLPADFVSRIEKQFANEVTDFFIAISAEPTVSFRINPRKIVVGKTTQEPIPWCKSGFYLQNRINFTTDPWFQSGAYYVQEAGSMFIQWILEHLSFEENPIKVLDACGAPGGKTTLLSSFFPTNTLIVANEVIGSRAEILRQNVERWGDPNVIVTNNDPKDFSRLPHFFDLCLVDAPWSGEGLFRREPHAIDQWSVENTRLCSQRQRRILMDVWPALKPGGILIYSTCTFNPEENEETLYWLANHHNFNSLKIPIENAWGIETINFMEITGYRFSFHRTRSEGFFVSVIQKNNEQEWQSPRKFRLKTPLNSPSKALQNLLRNWVENEFFWYQNKQLFSSNIHIQTIGLLHENLRVLRPGCLIATEYNNKIIPEHPLALSTSLNKENFPIVELTNEEIYRFFKNEPLSFPTLGKNRYLLTWQNLPVGFINHLGNRTNTSLPMTYRILKDFVFNGESIAILGFAVK